MVTEKKQFALGAITEQTVRKALAVVMDPEIPVVSVLDLGMITEIRVENNDHVLVRMTPTFAGCPAIEILKTSIYDAVLALGVPSVEVRSDYSTTWNSNRISDQGKQKLQKFGLAHPQKHDGEITIEMVADAHCPHCGSNETTLHSPFGSALCRSIHFCYACSQTFERFKPV